MPWVLEELEQSDTANGTPSPIHLRFVAPPPPRSPTTGERPVQLRLPVPAPVANLQSAGTARTQLRPSSGELQVHQEEPNPPASCSFLTVTPRHRRLLGVSPRNRLSPRFQRKCTHLDQKRDCHKPPSPRHIYHSLNGCAPSAFRPSHLTPRNRAMQLTPRSRTEAETSARLSQQRNTVAQLMKRLQDRDWASRKAAVESLGTLVTGDACVLDGVMLHLESKSEKTRQTAVWTLSRIVSKGNRGAVDRLLERIAHPALEVRMAALSALGQIADKGDQETLGGVLRKLNHADWLVREAAVDALLQVADRGDPLALEGLLRGLRDPDWRVRQVALEAAESLLDQALPSALLVLRCFSARAGVFAHAAAADSPAGAGTFGDGGGGGGAGGGGGIGLIAGGGADIGGGAIVGAVAPSPKHFAGLIFHKIVQAMGVPSAISCRRCGGRYEQQQPQANYHYLHLPAAAGAGLHVPAAGAAAAMTASEPTELCGQCAERLCCWVRATLLPPHWIAVAMGCHPRLGFGSPLSALDPALLPLIVAFCQAP